MPTLRHLLAAHSPVLVLDAASSNVQTGWLEGAPISQLPNLALAARWESSGDEATAAVFECVERLGRNPAEAGAFLFCEGPGSVLGIRTVAMAVRTWRVLQPRPAFSYCSLAAVAHALGRLDFAVIADARRDSWHHYQVGRGLRRVTVADIRSDAVMPENFRHWSELPADVARVPYLLEDILPRVLDADLLFAADNPDAFLHEEPSYATWAPQIHRAPGERSSIAKQP